VGTFHSISNRVLNIFIKELSPNYKKNFIIYDRNDQVKILKNTIKKLDLDINSYNTSHLLSLVSRLKNNHIQDEWETKWEFEDDNQKKIIYGYQSSLVENNAMDFDDLILNFYGLVSSNERVKKHLQKNFKYILVDEYQDTNEMQFKLLNVLAGSHKNLFVVGDEDQCIYGWRGASIKNILEFETLYPDTQFFKLEENYRSTPEILDVANQLISFNKERKDKELFTHNSNGSRIDVVRQFDNREEANYVASQISTYRKDNEFNLNEIAIFYRTNAQSRILEDVLRQNKIQYKIFGNISFYDRAEIKDIICFLRLLINPYDTISFDRIINIPPRGIGAKTLKTLKLLKVESNVDFISLIADCSNNNVFPKKVTSNLAKLSQALKDSLSDIENEMPISESIQKFLINIEFFDHISKDNEDKIENISEFLNLVSEYEQNTESPTLNDFLNTLSISSAIDDLDSKEGKVSLMTVHLAKGLEFPCVFIVGMEDGVFPHSRSLDMGESSIEEERRLCYVAFTRAMKKLHISHRRERNEFGAPIYCQQSQFIDEIEDNKNVQIIDGGYFEEDDNLQNKVSHYRFGEGVVVVDDIDDDIGDFITVRFDSGVKKRVSVFDLEEV
jgi:DNA helicase-2/ATP-dependent DNA helicase PcrA